MKSIVLLLCIFAFRPGCGESDRSLFLIETSMGDIEVEISSEQAPLTSNNFIRYVEAGAYENSSFFRVTNEENEADREIKIQVIQGGDIPDDKQRDPIRLEPTSETGLRHRRGAFSMARSSADTATSQFFICLRDEAELDFGGARHSDGLGFAVFGQVVNGMDVVEAINDLANKDQRLLEPVQILKIRSK